MPRAGEHSLTADVAGGAVNTVPPGSTRAGRIRQRVARAFFPADQAAVPGWLLAVITVGCAVLAATRRGSAGLNTLWAEDGQVFYQAALTHPLHAYVESYRGYLSTAPRVIATVVALFPVGQVAVANTVADSIVLGLLAALVYRACGEHIRNPWLRAVPAIVTAVCPVGKETWEATANLQWPMFFVAFVVLLWHPRRPVPVATGAVLVVLFALTSPFGLLLAPLAVVRVIALGRDRGCVIPVAFLAGVVVQAADMAIVGGRPLSPAFLPGITERRYAAFVAGQGFFGTRYSLPWQPLGEAVIIALLAALVLVAASGRLRPCVLAALAMAYSAVCFATLLVLSEDRRWVTLFAYPNRYNLPPFLLLAYAMTVLLDAGLPGGAGRRTGRSLATAERPLAKLPRLAALALCTVLACSLAWAAGTTWNRGDPSRQRPTWSSALASARAKCGRAGPEPARTVQVPITPTDPAKNWHVTLTCAQLRAG